MALRQPVNPDVINIRASYDNEAEALVAYFIKKKGAKRFAIFYQEDGFGQAVLSGTEKALKKRDMTLVGKGTFQRNTLAVKTGLASIAPANPDVIIMVGPYAPLAAFVKEAKSNGLKADLGTVSFVGTDNFLNALGDSGEGVVISQVVPLPSDLSIPIVKECHDLLTKYAPGEKLGFVSLEGAISAKAMVMALDKAGKDVSREAVISAFENMKNVDLGGMVLDMSKENHQASSTVFLTQLEGGKVVSIK
jgi:ABC-type branched-subunit amino acid transport system substrate-binding protein